MRLARAWCFSWKNFSYKWVEEVFPFQTPQRGGQRGGRGGMALPHTTVVHLHPAPPLSIWGGGAPGWEAAQRSVPLSRLSLLPGWLRTGSRSGGRLRCRGLPQKVGTGAKEPFKEGKQLLRFFSAVSGKSELRSSKLVFHVQDCSLSSGCESLMANSDGGWVRGGSWGTLRLQLSSQACVKQALFQVLQRLWTEMLKASLHPQSKQL